MRSMVEGYVRHAGRCGVRSGGTYPSTTLRVVPLPVLGRNLW